MPVCQVCQKDNPAGAEYCEDCGAALGAGTPTAQAPAPAAVGAAASSAPSVAPPADPAPSSPAPSSPAPSAPASPPASMPAAETGAPAPSPAPEASAAPAPAPTEADAAPSGEARSARLVAVRQGVPTGEEIPLLGQRLLVGRFDPETGPVDIDLSSIPESVHISRHHGELSRAQDGRWTVRDLGSANGVFVKGSDDPSFGPRITAPRPLSSGDEVAFGNARFIFRED